jgi:hypothetical protein
LFPVKREFRNPNLLVPKRGRQTPNTSQRIEPTNDVSQNISFEIEDVSSRQRLLNAGLRRPLFAALLASPLLTEPHDPTGAATGAGF